ncbi:hypothetical protein QFC19_009192 [Naganishia cerealis]|uniref:Uncharacterized protein n=1 Tax=Naganishia cerealis TaxID=610337 RepID=A0ACC2UXJ5_9TREE|nr:hypothetical protein QFC19_009192 [Naganishia cerealis]
MAVSDNEKPSRASEGKGRKEAPSTISGLITLPLFRGAWTETWAGSAPSTSSSIAPIPQKKYRTETLASVQSSRGSSPRSIKEDSIGGTTNDDTVKEVRQKVEDLSHDESTSDLKINEQHDTNEGQGATDSEQEAGRKRKQQERTISSQLVETDAKRTRDQEGDEVSFIILVDKAFIT